jgi:hypothetical protein
MSRTESPRASISIARSSSAWVCPFRCLRIAERNGIASSNLWGRILDEHLRRLHPAGSRPIPIALARARPVFVVFPSDRIAGFLLQRLLDNQSRRQLDQLVFCRSRRESPLDQGRQLFPRPHRSRYEIFRGRSVLTTLTTFSLKQASSSTNVIQTHNASRFTVLCMIFSPRKMASCNVVNVKASFQDDDTMGSGLPQVVAKS